MNVGAIGRFGNRTACGTRRNGAAASAEDADVPARSTHVDRAGCEQRARGCIARGGIGKVETDGTAGAGQFQTTVVAVFSAVVAVGIISPLRCGDTGRGRFRDLIDGIFLAGINTERNETYGQKKKDCVFHVETC